MPVSRQQIIRVFRKYSLLDQRRIPRRNLTVKENNISDEDVEMPIGLLAKEYNKQDGSSVDVSHTGALG
jgi:hypothetical protein